MLRAKAALVRRPRRRDAQPARLRLPPSCSSTPSSRRPRRRHAGGGRHYRVRRGRRVRRVQARRRDGGRPAEAAARVAGRRRGGGVGEGDGVQPADSRGGARRHGGGGSSLGFAGDDAAALAARGTKMLPQEGDARRHRRQPFPQLFCGYGEGMTPLVAAMTLGSPATVGNHPSMAAPTPPAMPSNSSATTVSLPRVRSGGQRRDHALLPSAFPQYVNKPLGGGTTLRVTWATWTSSCQRQAEMIRTLLDLGAAGSIDTQQMFWVDALMNLAWATTPTPSLRTAVGLARVSTSGRQRSGMMKARRRCRRSARSSARSNFRRLRT